MEKLIRFIVEELTGHSENIEIEISDESIKIVVDKADMGRVIGKQGKIAKAIRTIVKAVGMKQGKKFSVEISEREE